MKRLSLYHIVGCISALALSGCHSAPAAIALVGGSMVACASGACAPEEAGLLKEKTRYTANNVGEAIEHAGHQAGGVVTKLKEDSYELSYKIEKWMFTEPETPAPKVIDTRYCYRSLQDVICYRQPLAGAEHRLISYQGTYADEPMPPRIKLLATHEHDPSQTPESRVANAKPVFIELPMDVQEDQSVMDASGEDVKIIHKRPNPSLVPQL